MTAFTLVTSHGLFVKYLRKLQVDKRLPAMSYLSAAQKETFASPLVEFKQANLSSDAGVKKVKPSIRTCR